MRKIAVVVILALCAVSAFAQSNTDSKFDVFGGYQFTSVDDSLNGNGHVGLNGWNAAATGFLTPHFGITADFSGAYGSPNEGGINVDTKIHTYMFGPTVRGGSEKATAFAHALFGAAHARGDVSGFTATDNAFAMAVGGGLDLAATRNVSFRVGQFDYLMTRFASEKQNNFRYSAGIVFHF